MTNAVNYSNQYQVNNPEEMSAGQIFSAAINENPVLNAMGITTDVLAKTAVMMPPLYIADKFINSKMAGREENKTWLKKIADYGDRLSEKHPKLKKYIEKSDDFFGKNKFFRYFTDDFATKPRNSLAVGAVEPFSHLAKDLTSKLKEIKRNKEYSHLFAQGGKSLTPATLKFMEEIERDPIKAEKQVDKLIQASRELIKEGVADSSKLQLLSNRLKAQEGLMGKTKLGSMLSKAALNLKFNFTLGGGWFGAFFGGLAINRAYKSTKEAPDGEKVSTCMHVLVEEVAGMIAAQMGAKLLYNIAGNKYRGMTKDSRAAVEDLIKKTEADEKILDEQIKVFKLQRKLLINGVNKNEVMTLSGRSYKEAAELASKMESTTKSVSFTDRMIGKITRDKYRGMSSKLKSAVEQIDKSIEAKEKAFDKSLEKARAQRDKLIKGDTKLKFWEKPLKLAGRFLGMGLDEIQRTKFTIFGSKWKPTIKGTAGGALRLFVIFKYMTPLILEPVMAVSHKIFGTPKTLIAKEEAMGNDEPIAQEGAKEQLTLQTKQGETNLINKLSNKQPQKNIKNENSNRQNAVAAAKLEGEKDKEEIYIPSINVDYSYVEEKENIDNERTREVLRQADSRIKHLSEVLNNK